MWGNRKKGQVVIEFLLLVGMAFFMVVTLLTSVMSVSESNTKVKTYDDLNDMGISIQEEFLLAAQLEDGYIRNINLPATVNGKGFNATIGQSLNNTGSYLILGYETIELFYELPEITGNITSGNNVLKKINGTLTLN